MKAARYNGANTFTMYPDGVGREIVIDKDGVYDIFFKPYEIGNPNYWFITPAFVEEITETQKVIRVNKSARRVKGGMEVNPPKTQASIRTITISDECLRLLIGLRNK